MAWGHPQGQPAAFVEIPVKAFSLPPVSDESQAGRNDDQFARNTTIPV
jgi:hypothetical protein